MTICTDCKGLGWRLRELEQGGITDLKKIDLGFIASDWRGLNFIEIIPSGLPGNNQIGPHELPAGTYNVQVWMYIDNGIVKQTDLNIIINRVSGLITLYKEGKIKPFAGRVVIDYAPI